MIELESLIIRIILRCQEVSNAGMDWIALAPIRGFAEEMGLPRSSVQFAVDILTDRGILDPTTYESTPSVTNLFRLLEPMTPTEIWEVIR